MEEGLVIQLDVIGDVAAVVLKLNNWVAASFNRDLAISHCGMSYNSTTIKIKKSSNMRTSTTTAVNISLSAGH